MTEAYTLGFCKTAEAYGVDPGQLVKAAQLSSIARALKVMPRYARALKGMPHYMMNPSISAAGRAAIRAGRLTGGLSNVLGRALRPIGNTAVGRFFGNGVARATRGLGSGVEAAGGKIMDAVRRVSPEAARKLEGVGTRLNGLGQRFMGGFTDAQLGIPATAPAAEGMIRHPLFSSPARVRGMIRRSLPPSPAEGMIRQSLTPRTTTTVPGLTGNRVPQTISRPVVTGLP